MANASIYAAFERMWQHITNANNAKVDKVEGKDLSTNDFTDYYKSFLDENIGATGGGDLTNSNFAWVSRENNHYSLMWKGEDE